MIFFFNSQYCGRFYRYSEAMGIPQLRKDVATMYESDTIASSGVLIGAPQELILIGMRNNRLGISILQVDII